MFQQHSYTKSFRLWSGGSPWFDLVVSTIATPPFPPLISRSQKWQLGGGCFHLVLLHKGGVASSFASSSGELLGSGFSSVSVTSSRISASLSEDLLSSSCDSSVSLFSYSIPRRKRMHT